MYANVLRNGNKSISLHVGKTLLKIKSRYMDRLKNVSRVFLAGLILCAMTLLSACSEKVEPEQRDETVNLTLRLDQVFLEKAYIRLLHDGAPDDFWYYMLTDDFQTEASVLIEAELERVLNADGKIRGNVGTNKNITLEGLQPKTEYRIIAARITPAGKVTGEVAELVFETDRNPDVFEEWPAWKITYKERRVAADDPDMETEVFTCAVNDEASDEPYIPCLITKKDFASAYGSNLRRCFEDYISYCNSLNYKWSDEISTTASEFVQDRLVHDDYVLFMIGVDAEGKLTGYYSKTEFTLEQEKATEAYMAWLGEWKLTGMTNSGMLEYTVEIVPDERNLYYKMYGYEIHTINGLEEIPNIRPLKLYFEKKTGDVYVISEALPDIEDNQALADFWDFFVYGSVEVMYGDQLTIIPVDIPNIRIASFSLDDASHASAKGAEISIDLYDKHYDTNFVTFNYFYLSLLGEFNYVLKSSDLVMRTNTMRFEKL